MKNKILKMMPYIFAAISYFGAACCGAFIAVIIECSYSDFILVGGSILGAAVAVLGNVANKRVKIELASYETENK